jgi:anti-sigma factor RsiW
MSPERFKALISAYGGAPDRWPAAERAAAERRLADHADLLEVERALDAALDAWAPKLASAALRERILAAGPREPRRRWSWRQAWLPGAGLAAACAAGAVVGATLVGPSLANAFPSEHGEAARILFDGVSVFGSPVDLGAAR